MTYYKWNKGDYHHLTPHFTTKDFTCPCSNAECVEQLISVHLLEALEDIRNEQARPLMVSSGFRCHAHQLELAASGHETAIGVSQHELGNAADIFSYDMKRLGTLLPAHFDAIGTSRHFFHVDERRDKQRRWSYKQ